MTNSKLEKFKRLSKSNRYNIVLKVLEALQNNDVFKDIYELFKYLDKDNISDELLESIYKIILNLWEKAKLELEDKELFKIKKIRDFLQKIKEKEKIEKLEGLEEVENLLTKI